MFSFVFEYKTEEVLILLNKIKFLNLYKNIIREQ